METMTHQNSEQKIEQFLVNRNLFVMSKRDKGGNLRFARIEILNQGGYSQNFLRKFVKFFVTLGLNILGFLRLNVLFQSKY